MKHRISKWKFNPWHCDKLYLHVLTNYEVIKIYCNISNISHDNFKLHPLKCIPYFLPVQIKTQYFISKNLSPISILFFHALLSIPHHLHNLNQHLPLNLRGRCIKIYKTHIFCFCSNFQSPTQIQDIFYSTTSKNIHFLLPSKFSISTNILISINTY